MVFCLLAVIKNRAFFFHLHNCLNVINKSRRCRRYRGTKTFAGHQNTFYANRAMHNLINWYYFVKEEKKLQIHY